MKKDYVIRNDLAVLKKDMKKISSFDIEDITIRRYQKNQYWYTNILFSSLESVRTRKLISKTITKELKEYFKKYHLSKKSSCFLVGLGNPNVICDSLGPKTTEQIITTGYLKTLNISSCYRFIYSTIPGTLKSTGIEPFMHILSLIDKLHPDFLIIIDSLLSSNVNYLNRVIQITDAGITPGSGIANYQAELSFHTFHIPVFVIGMPLAIEASTIIRDALNKKTDKITFHDGYDFIVSSKDIDEVIPLFSETIASGINRALNSNISQS